MSMPPPGDGFGGYAGQQYGQYAAEDQQPQQGYEDQAAAQQPQQHEAAHHKKKKRGYAAQAFEVGTGANAVAGSQTQSAPQQYGAPVSQAAPGYGGYQAEPQAAAPQGYPSYGAQQPAAQAPQYGYQAPDQGYPAPGAGQPAPGIGGITQGMGNMSVGGQPQQQQQAAQQARPAVLNQLYPTDLLSQPFNVSELDLPPPPIVLPPQHERDPISKRQLLPAILPIYA
ncbi:hypothetical protein CDV31_007341 [Fusarium ambrosium]|uniref:Uncharacterized protein n=1 Tax=Fusarium ambrosium TaxID=131363 RepID=A0A428U7F4_9HYPO|nr:hypothetical protein CDV31_007341 [Fusarium ambrosium]